jgi:hypothetical protein
MKLSGRVLPEVPPTAAALADEVEKLYAQLSIELDEVLQGVSEEEASHRPGEGQWSAKEVVAHLALSERFEHYIIGSWIAGDEPLAAPGNQPSIVSAFLSVRPTLADVRAELKRLQAETVALIRALPEDFVSRKSTYTRMGQGLLQGALHPHLHFDQIREALAETRK